MFYGSWHISSQINLIILSVMAFYELLAPQDQCDDQCWFQVLTCCLTWVPAACEHLSSWLWSLMSSVLLGFQVVHPTLVNMVSQEHLVGFSSDLAQMSTLMQEWTDSKVKVTVASCLLREHHISETPGESLNTSSLHQVQVAKMSLWTYVWTSESGQTWL